MVDTISDEVPAPGYFTSKPVFASVRMLREYCGFQDSCIQFNELALRYMGEVASAAQEASPKYLRELFIKYHISAGAQSLSDVRHLAARSYIVQVYHAVETFLHELIREYQTLKRIAPDKWKRKIGQQDLDLLAQVAANLPAKARKAMESYPEFSLLNYYRLVRNEIVHADSRMKSSSKTGYRALIKDHAHHFRVAYAGLVAPNDVDSLNYDDFVLYTRAIKYYANVINDVCDLTIEDLAVAAMEDPRIIGTAKAKLSSPLRMSRWLRSYFCQRYGTNASDYEQPFVEEMILRLKSHPNQRARRR